MKDQDLSAEIEQMKEQLARLAAARGGQPEQDDASVAGEGSPTGGTTGEAGLWMRDLLKQAEELIGGLDLQFKDVPARTALVIFALGVLMGRLLSRRG